MSSLLFWGVLAVNKELETWAKQNLLTKNAQYFPNFIPTIKSDVLPETFLKGASGKRIIALANLRNPKNHLQILKAFISSKAIALGWSLHLIGNDYLDAYANELKKFISKNNIQNNVHIYGSCNDVEHILNQADIGILGSTYEGFPVTLLEYGKAKLCVLSTNVGYCKDVIKDLERGLLFSPENLSDITEKLNYLVSSHSERLKYSEALQKFVLNNYTDKIIINKYLDWLEQNKS